MWKVEVCAPGPEARQRAEDTGAPRKWEVMSTGTFNFGWHNYKRSISARNPARGPRQRGSYYFIEQKTNERDSFIHLVFVEGLLYTRPCPRHWWWRTQRLHLALMSLQTPCRARQTSNNKGRIAAMLMPRRTCLCCSESLLGRAPLWARCCPSREGGKGGDRSCHLRSARIGVWARLGRGEEGAGRVEESQAERTSCTWVLGVMLGKKS